MSKLFFTTGLLMLFGGMNYMTHRTTSANAIPVYNASEVTLRASKGIWYTNAQPFTGKLIELNSSADTISISQYVNGREHGQWKSYYNKKSLRYVRNYEYGKKSGELMMWHENGRLQMKANFLDDEYEGSLMEWDDAGNLLKSLNYSKGHESGAQRAWYPNGKIRSNYTVIDGRRYGLLGTKHCINVSDSIASF